MKKVQIGHVIISFARTEDMRLRDELNIYVNKFRPGRIKVNSFMEVKFNNGTCKFDFSSCQENGVDNSVENNQQYNTNIAIQAKNSLKNK